MFCIEVIILVFNSVLYICSHFKILQSRFDDVNEKLHLFWKHTELITLFALFLFCLSISYLRIFKFVFLVDWENMCQMFTDLIKIAIKQHQLSHYVYYDLTFGGGEGLGGFWRRNKSDLWWKTLSLFKIFRSFQSWKILSGRNPFPMWRFGLNYNKGRLTMFFFVLFWLKI